MTNPSNFAYEADWRPYAFPAQSAEFTSEKELADTYTTVSLKRGQPLAAGGMPIQSDGNTAIVNTENEMSLIFGGTASKKSRTLIAPLIAMLAQAGESMVIPDIKGEFCNGALSAPIQGILQENGYRRIYLNFRDLNSDGYNLLAVPYTLYKSGRKDEAVILLNNLVDALAGIYRNTIADPFWEQTARQYLIGLSMLLFELCDDPKKVNMLSLASYTDEDSAERLQRMLRYAGGTNNMLAMLRAVLSEPDKTRSCTLSTVMTFLNGFLTNTKLLRMLSISTFTFDELYKKKTALFLILPDEVDTYAGMVGLLLSQISATLVQDAYTLGGQLPRRVNFVCDEFCNYYVPNMHRNISAHRSRNIRWYLVCQGLQQLETVYKDAAPVILANCKNIWFLSSSELSLLELLSRRAGETLQTPDGRPRPLISVQDLICLKKGWDWTDVYFTTGAMNYVSHLPDISGYTYLQHYTEPGTVPHKAFLTLDAFLFDEMLDSFSALATAYVEVKGKPSFSKINPVLLRKSQRFEAAFGEFKKMEKTKEGVKI